MPLDFGVVTAIPTTTYKTAYYDPFFNASWDFSTQAPILFNAIGHFFGPDGNVYVYGTILLTILGLIWIRTENAAIPMALIFILGNVFFWTPGLVPDGYLWIVRAFLYLCVAGVAYIIYRGR